ncbi:hypothetical protein ACIQWA_40610 [Kitasatospora sp. NPDC098652]|uniref:hypothetical protein n=1 Tax=Kitasatospora sp. NPDC098652 TaxID=3364095 RepID=UPI0037FCD3FE
MSRVVSLLVCPVCFTSRPVPVLGPVAGECVTCVIDGGRTPGQQAWLRVTGDARQVSAELVSRQGWDEGEI